MALSIEPAALDDPAAVALVSASVSELEGRYDGEPGSGAIPQPEYFVPPDGLFLLAQLDGRAVGCGGIARIDAAAAELKRLYVAPVARGHGVGRALLRSLLAGAADLGYARVRLETGERMPEALALYRSVSFEPVPCWGPYADHPRSRCFELVLP